MMTDLINEFKYRKITTQEPNDNLAIFFDKNNEENFNNNLFNTLSEENYFNNEENTLLNNKRKKDSKQKARKPHTKYTYDNLKRECKHLVIENVMIFINKKIYEVYNGDVGDGITKKQLVKLNQEQKKNSNAEFNKLFIYKTLKEIFSEKITKRIKILEEDHNKNLIRKLIEEKKEDFESLFNITFIECVQHFIEEKQINELKGLTLFNELREKIINKYKDDGETYYNNLEILLKEFEKRINNSSSKKRKMKSI